MKKIIKIERDKCIGCGACEAGCAWDVIEIVDGVARVRNPENCDGAGKCIRWCPNNAITLIPKE